MVGQLSSLVGDEVGTHMYDLLNRVLANPRATARVPTSLHRAPALTMIWRGSPADLPDRVQMWRVCSVFFYFSLAAPWPGTAPQAGAREIWCNCGAFAPYFFQVLFLPCMFCQIGCWLTPGRPQGSPPLSTAAPALTRIRRGSPAVSAR